jgi:CheY-like chemotaxis protein
VAPRDSGEAQQALALLERLGLVNRVQVFGELSELFECAASAAGRIDAPPPRLLLIDPPGQARVELPNLLADIQSTHANARIVLLGGVSFARDADRLTAPAPCLCLAGPMDVPALVCLVDQLQVGWWMVTSNPSDSRHGKPFEVLLVDDSSIDAALVRGIFKRFRIGNEVRRVPDGDAALAYLRRQGVYRDAARPGLVLLDLNMPGRSGWEVLQEIKADAGLRAIPVAIHSVSEFSEEIERAETLGACCFLVKPISLEKLLENTPRLGCGWAMVQP